ncbi:Hsp20/alpha crystallin family protein [Peribacillus sp. SCS-155]|uniref:Hsp20/alpha crystallin family protein n=1 Tax=Peribacillus sedimenti TaxID=3115297 RepID=UPI00390607CA
MNMKPNEVQSFINQIFSQVIPETMQQLMDQNLNNMTTPQAQASPNNPPQPNSLQNNTNAEVFETHSLVYVRIPVTNTDLMDDIRVFHTTNQCIIEGLPEKGKKHVITLPALIRKKGSTAKYKNGTLEIRLIKNSDDQLSEIDVTEE